jgi:hypothetical protein
MHDSPQDGNDLRISKPLMMENWHALLLFKKTHGVTREQTVALRHGSLDAVAWQKENGSR